MFIGYAQVSRVDRNLPLQGDALTEALSEAEERLADRTFFTLDAERWDAFIAALDAPPRRHPRLERLFREPSVFDPEP